MVNDRIDNNGLSWGYLLHLGYNMWDDRDASEQAPERGKWQRDARPYVRCDKALWDEITRKLADAGANQLVIDLGEAVRYESHPEIAVEGAWSVTELKQELARLRGLGLEPIPKMNFSTAHDTWLGAYHRCVSTETYYQVCRDLIREACEIFEKPRLFHLGMDEETVEHQRHCRYMVVRQYDLWWHDMLFYADQVKKHGARPWIWSDYVWRHPDAFYQQMPRKVLQSNWYYRMQFDTDDESVKAFGDLDQRGYDQVPTGSADRDPDNLPKLVEFCLDHIAPERLHGFLQTIWMPTLPEYQAYHMQAIDAIQRARATFAETATKA